MKHKKNTHGAEGDEVGFVIDDELDLGFTEQEPEKPKKRIKRFLRRLLSVSNIMLLLCILIFGVCMKMLFERFVDYRRSDDIYLTLSEDLFGDVADIPSFISGGGAVKPEAGLFDYNTVLESGVSRGEVAENPNAVTDINYARIKAKLQELCEINDEVYGWIRVEGTSINYPVVLGEDNEFYLTHAYNGEYLRSGTIFADYRSSDESVSNNWNTVLYGHNMANGTMFADVKALLKDEERFRDATVYLYTLDGVYVYEPFLLMNTVESFYYFQVYFRDGAEFEDFIGRMLDNANFKTNVKITGEDRIITLSTCTNRASVGRVCMMARLVRIDNAAKK